MLIDFKLSPEFGICSVHSLISVALSWVRYELVLVVVMEFYVYSAVVVWMLSAQKSHCEVHIDIFMFNDNTKALRTYYYIYWLYWFCLFFLEKWIFNIDLQENALISTVCVFLWKNQFLTFCTTYTLSFYDLSRNLYFSIHDTWCSYHWFDWQLCIFVYFLLKVGSVHSYVPLIMTPYLSAKPLSYWDQTFQVHGMDRHVGKLETLIRPYLQHRYFVKMFYGLPNLPSAVKFLVRYIMAWFYDLTKEARLWI